jgi:hypothetical protein
MGGVPVARGLWCGGVNVAKADFRTSPAPPPVTSPLAPAGSCAAGYARCIPAYPPDLDCGDIGFTVTVTGDDPHRLDADGDGYGCE